MSSANGIVCILIKALLYRPNSHPSGMFNYSALNLYCFLLPRESGGFLAGLTREGRRKKLLLRLAPDRRASLVAQADDDCF